MRITPIFNPQNIINNPPQITNHPLFEHMQIYSQEFKANEKDLFHQTLKKEKKRDTFMGLFFAASLAIVTFALYRAYKNLKNGIKKISTQIC